MDFDQKVVIITGASSGIGEACALHFAKAGALLSITGRNDENLNKLAHRCTQFYGKDPLVVKADITIAADVEKIVDKTVSHYGQIDVLVNNAGILLMSGMMDDIADLDKMIATNVRGTFLLTQRTIPHLIRTKGNIVTISSVVSTITVPTMMSYSMTKAALDTFTRCVAMELGPKGVRANSVNPGPVTTNLFINGGMNHEEYKKKFEQLVPLIPLRVISDAEHVADLVTFLASDRAKCITGSFHYIDGGLHLGGPVLQD